MKKIHLFIWLPLAAMILTNAICPIVVIDGKLNGVLPLENQKVKYSEVVDCGAVTQAELFRRSRLWLAQSLTGDKLGVNDKDTGDLVSTNNVTVIIPRTEADAGGIYKFQYTLTVESANRKYRSTISNVLIQDGDQQLQIETYCQPKGKDLKPIYADLDKILKIKLADLQENVRNYKAF